MCLYDEEYNKPQPVKINLPPTASEQTDAGDSNCMVLELGRRVRFDPLSSPLQAASIINDGLSLSYPPTIMAATPGAPTTLSDLKSLLENDIKVKVAGKVAASFLTFLA